jgi:hypothetical protein
MTKASDNPYPSVLFMETGAPAAPAAGYQRLYLNSSNLNVINASNTIRVIGSGAGGSVATDAIWDAAGDIAVGTGANTAAKKTIGSVYQTLRVKSGAADVEWAGGMSLWSEISLAGGAAASIDFTSIPATGRHIIIDCMVRGAVAATYDDFYVQVNTDTGANYDYELQSAYQTTNAASQGLAANHWALGQPAAASATAGIFSYFRIYLPFYANTVHRKTGYAQGSDITTEGSGGFLVRHVYVHWRSASAITSVKLYFAGGNVAADSIASLYLVS